MHTISLSKGYHEEREYFLTKKGRIECESVTVVNAECQVSLYKPAENSAGINAGYDYIKTSNIVFVYYSHCYISIKQIVALMSVNMHIPK